MSVFKICQFGLLFLLTTAAMADESTLAKKLATHFAEACAKNPFQEQY